MRKCAHFLFIRQDDPSILCNCSVSASDAPTSDAYCIQIKALAITANSSRQCIIYHFYYSHEFSHSYFHGLIFDVNSNGVNICNKPLPLTICISSRLRPTSFRCQKLCNNYNSPSKRKALSRTFTKTFAGANFAWSDGKKGA